MVKFSKQFEGQLVPEWKEAFVDYWTLKKDLKKIHLLNNNSSINEQKYSFSNTLLASIKNLSFFGHQRRDNHELIHVKIAYSLSLSFVHIEPIL